MSISFYYPPYGFGTKMSRWVDATFASESATEPVTLTQTKAHLYIDTANTDFDAFLSTTDNLIKRVRQYIEEITGRALVSKTVTFYVDYESPFPLPFVLPGNTISVTSASVKTAINSYEAKTVNSDYEIDGGKFVSMIGNYRWKLVYGITAVVPEGLKMAILNEIARRFDHRGDREVSDTNQLIEPYKDLYWLT